MVKTSTHTHTHTNLVAKNQKKREEGRGEGLWVWGIQTVSSQFLDMVCGVVRGLSTKVWVWSGVEEEVEIEENDGEGKEEWHFFGMGTWSCLFIIQI